MYKFFNGDARLNPIATFISNKDLYKLYTTTEWPDLRVTNSEFNAIIETYFTLLLRSAVETGNPVELPGNLGIIKVVRARSRAYSFNRMIKKIKIAGIKEVAVEDEEDSVSNIFQFRVWTKRSYSHKTLNLSLSFKPASKQRYLLGEFIFNNPHHINNYEYRQ